MTAARIMQIRRDNLPDGHREFLFFCPGCGYGHPVSTPRWVWNGDTERPTFSPSILTGADAPDYTERRCHSYIKDGQIQFLPDCWHELKGQTVDLPDMRHLGASSGKRDDGAGQDA
jgi:hypothetical protein